MAISVARGGLSCRGLVGRWGGVRLRTSRALGRFVLFEHTFWRRGPDPPGPAVPSVYGRWHRWRCCAGRLRGWVDWQSRLARDNSFRITLIYTTINIELGALNKQNTVSSESQRVWCVGSRVWRLRRDEPSRQIQLSHAYTHCELAMTQGQRRAPFAPRVAPSAFSRLRL